MQKNMVSYVRIGSVRFARYCGKMYSRHLFPYGGLGVTIIGAYKLYFKKLILQQ